MKKQIPPVSILNPKFKYIPSAATDVQKTWQKFGWKPPSKSGKK